MSGVSEELQYIHLGDELLELYASNDAITISIKKLEGLLELLLAGHGGGGGGCCLQVVGSNYVTL